MSQSLQAQQITISVSELVAYNEHEVAKFWNKCLPMLRAIFLWKLWTLNITKEEAEELATDTMQAIHKRLSGLGNMTSDQLFNYVAQSGYNRAIEYRKSEYRRRNLFEPLSESAAVQSDPSKRIVERIALENALSKLSKRERKVFYLMYKEGRSIKETASIAGLSEDNVKQIGSRAKKKVVAEVSKQIKP